MNQNLHIINQHIGQNENMIQQQPQQHYKQLSKESLSNISCINIGRTFGKELTNYGIKQDHSIDTIRPFNVTRNGIIPPKKTHIQGIVSRSNNNSMVYNHQKENTASILSCSNNNSMVIEVGANSKDNIAQYYQMGHNQIQNQLNHQPQHQTQHQPQQQLQNQTQNQSHQQSIIYEDHKLESECNNNNNSTTNDQKSNPHLKTVIPSTTVDNEDNDDYEHLDQIDKDNYPNIQYVVPYVKSIFKHLRATEGKFIAKSGYMSTVQTDINEKMRGILIDWLIDVHIKFKLLPETLFMTVNLIDRYLSKVLVTKQKLQLVGISSLLIASKYEEIYPPEIKEFEYISDGAYTREEIFDMEGKILSTLAFNLTATSTYRFLERYGGMLAKLDEKAFNLTRYLLELTLIEYKMIRYMPSLITCAAIYLANKIYRKEGWPDILQKHTKYTESQIKPCAKDLFFILQNAHKNSLQAVRRKFASAKYSEISKIYLDKV